MSDQTQNVTALAPESTETEAPKESKFASLRRKVTTPIKNHPKIATAVGLGVVMVGAAAFAGRAENSALEDLVEEYPVEDETNESDDTEVA